MKQQDLGLNFSCRCTRRQVLLDEMTLVMPCAELVAIIVANAPVAKTGRPPFAIEMLLRIHCLQQWFGLSDLAAEEALFEMVIYREFVGLSGTNRIPNRVSILRSGKTLNPRHLLEAHDLSRRILQLINNKLSAQGLMLKSGTVVDATADCCAEFDQRQGRRA